MNQPAPLPKSSLQPSHLLSPTLSPTLSLTQRALMIAFMGFVGFGCVSKKLLASPPPAPQPNVSQTQRYVSQTQRSASDQEVQTSLKKSTLLQESGEARLGQPFPFFSGWGLKDKGSSPLNLTKILTSGKSRYVITICASWCAPCREGLKTIQAHREEFERANVGLVVLVADKSKHAKDLRAEFGLSWASVIVDEFQTYAMKMSPNIETNKGLNLPRTFVLDRDGKVELIIGEEGDDFISLMLKGAP